MQARHNFTRVWLKVGIKRMIKSPTYAICSRSMRRRFATMLNNFYQLVKIRLGDLDDFSLVRGVTVIESGGELLGENFTR